MNTKTLQRGLLLSTSILVGVVGYGRRAYAGPVGCTISTEPTYLCSGAVTSSISIEKNNADVITVDGFSASVSGGGNAIDITGYGQLSFTDAFASSIAATDGAIGLNLNSHGSFDGKLGITIVTDGDISGTGTGVGTAIWAAIDSTVYAGLISLDVGGTIAGTVYGISTRNLSAGATEITVDADAYISGAGGISATSNTKIVGGGDLSVTVDGDVHASGLASKKAVTVLANSLGAASLTVNAGGSISSDGSRAAQVAALGIGGTVTVEVAEGASISSDGVGLGGLYAYSGWSNTTVTIDGEVSATGYHVTSTTVRGNDVATLTVGAAGSISSALGIGATVKGGKGATAAVASGGTVTGSTGLQMIGGIGSAGIGNIDVTVDGEVASTAGGTIGIDAYARWGDTSIEVNEGGRVYGATTAMTFGAVYNTTYGYYSSGDLSITIDGEVASKTDAAITAAMGARGDVVLTVGRGGQVSSESGDGIVITRTKSIDATIAGEVSAADGKDAIQLSSTDGTTVELQSGYDITGAVVVDGASNTLRLGGSDTGADADSFDVSLLDDELSSREQFQGFDTFEKVGLGDWTLTGTPTARVGDWQIDAGRLFVAGTMTGTTFSVAEDATVGGTGTIGGVTLVSGSHIAPGSAAVPGTLTVNDDVAFVAGSVFDVMVGSKTASKLVVNGKATLDSEATVRVNAIDPGADYTDGASYTILATEDGYDTGRFSDTVEENFAFIDVALVYEGNDVLLNLTRNAIDFDAVAGTPDQKAVAVAIEGLEGGNAIYDAIAVLDEEGAQTAFETLSGNTLASVPNMVIGEAASFDALLEARSDVVSAAGSESAYVAPAASANAAAAATADLLAPLALDSGFWLRGTGTAGTIESDGNGSGADYRTGGIAAGVDTWVTPNLLAGAAIDYALMGASFADGGGTATVSSATVALYSRYEADALTLDGRIGFGVTDTDTERSVVVGSDSYTALGAFGGIRFQASASAGYDLLMLGGAQLRPVASLGYVRLAEDGFTETGADVYGLTVSDRVTESLKSGVGFEVTQRVALGDRADGLSLTAKAVWQHEFLDDHSTFDATFADYPSAAFSVDGPVVGRDSAVLGLEADAQASDTMSLYGRYDLRLNPDRVDQSISAGLRGAW